MLFPENILLNDSMNALIIANNKKYLIFSSYASFIPARKSFSF